jgi:hypothetical protein
MLYDDEAVPKPGGICEKCLCSPLACHPLCDGSPVLVAYCRHNRTGGFIQPSLPEARWTMFSPVDEPEWRLFISEPICDVIEADHMHLMDKEDHYCKCPSTLATSRGPTV